MCDIVLAAPSATFGQPEINLGVIPGGGATQRLTHAVGKSRAMELVLTGRTFSAAEAERWGVVSRVVGEGEGVVVEEAVKMAGVIAGKGRVSVVAAKETVNAAYELSLNEGLRLERRTFHSLFATNDQKEGVYNFLLFDIRVCSEVLLQAWPRLRKSGRRTSRTLRRAVYVLIVYQNIMHGAMMLPD